MDRAFVKPLVDYELQPHEAFDNMHRITTSNVRNVVVDPFAVLAGSVVALLLPLMAGCNVIPLDPNIPAIEAAPPITGPAAELTVVVEEGAYRDPRSLNGFSVQVDGRVRGWIPGLTGTVRMNVDPGQHRVVVAHPYRFVGLWMGVPVPESGMFRGEATVACKANKVCRVIVTPTLLRDKGLVLRATPVTDAD